VAGALGPGGLFAFTAQATPGPGFRLGEDMRFHHSEAYLRATAAEAGLAVSLLEPAATRLDRGEPVPGFVVVLARSGSEAAARRAACTGAS
jgi:predicted TPR repeat methyltransferase